MQQPPLILNLEEIKKLLPKANLFEDIKSGFVAFSKGEAVIPPVGELLIPEHEGEVHIKYGYLKSAPYYVVKIASGFYANANIGLPTGNGLMLLFDKSNGRLKCILQDEGYLTDVRTAVAGALSASNLAKKSMTKVGIVGTGIQAHLQLEYLAKVWTIESAFVWGRNVDKAQAYTQEMAHLDFPLEQVEELEDLCRKSDIIITTTPAKEAIIQSDWIQGPKCIVAIGSDTPEKGELDPTLYQRASLSVVDSLAQSQSRGEVFQARKRGFISDSSVVELGSAMSDNLDLSKEQEGIIIADLTGIAVQDLMIAKAVFELAEKA